MRPISWRLSAGLMILAAASAWAQVPARAFRSTGISHGNGGAASGKPQPWEPRRKALLGAIDDWNDAFLPAGSEQSPLTQKYQPPLHEIKTAAVALNPGEALEPVEQRFEDWKQQVLGELYEQNKERFFSDPQRFSEFMQERLDTLSAIRAQKARAPKQIAHFERLKEQINTLPDRATLDRIYDRVGGFRATKASAPIRLVSFYGPVRHEPLEGETPATAAVSLDRSVPPPATVLASFKSESATTSTLSRIISTVSSTARRYANTVATAIVSVSHRLGIDEKLHAALVWCESCFDPHATSAAGAQGLSQLMPGTAQDLGVSNAYDINQNINGGGRYLKARLDHFSNDDEIRYMQGLYAWGKMRVQSGRPVEEVWKEVFAKTPMGIKNAIASYNAGQGAIDYYGHGRYDQLPVRHTAYAESHNLGYWQTIHYVPVVMRRYFEIQLQTPSRGAPSPNGSVSV